MEDYNNASLPFFKKLDKELFERIDKFKLSSGYNNIQDFYNGLEEDYQRVFKASVVLVIFVIPVAFLGLVWWQNESLKEDLKTRIALISKANEVIGQKQSLRNVSPNILSDNPIDGSSMMTSRLSNLLTSVGADLSKIQVSNFNGQLVGSTIMRSEADFSFNNLTTDELMNVFTAMIRDKFRIQSVDISRNADSNLLKGTFHAIHLSNAQSILEEE
jgi:hypothetical protein